MALSQRIQKKLKQLYGKKPGVKVGDPKKIKKTLASGTSIPQYRKKGGHVRKKK